MTSLSRVALAAALSLLVAMPAVAADNYTIQSGGATRTIRAKDLGAAIAPMSIAIDGAGLERFTTSNPGYVVFPSGTVLPISATALPLPAGAATVAAQTTGNAALGSPSDTAWDGASTSASITSILKGLPRTAGGGSSGLPAGASTSALQTSGNASLTSLDSKLPALASGRVPVDGSAVTQPVSSASLGAPSDATWDGSAASASQPSILKAIWSKLAGLLTVDTVVRAPAVDKGTILTGASQPLAGANPSRRGLIIQNKGSSDFNYNCRGLTAADDEHNFRIPAGQAYDTPPHHSGTGACNGIGAAGGKLLFLEF